MSFVKRNAWKWIAGAVAVLVVLAALAPYLASLGLFRNALVRAVMPPVEGSVRCGSASLGWFSPIVLENIEIRSADDAPVLSVEQLTGDQPLWKMLVDRSDLGTFRIVQPHGNLVLSKSGTNLADVFVGRPKTDDEKRRRAASRRNLALAVELVDGSVSVRHRDSPGIWTAGPINFALAIEPSADGQPDLVIEPGTVLPQTAVTPEACRDLLKYIAPVLADATEVRGDFSIEVDRWRLPLADPTQGEGSGRLIISSLQVAPGPLVAELARLLRVPPNLLVIEEAPITFRMADGRIHHSDLTFRIEGLTVHSRGSVGTDGSLALVADVPMPEEVLGDGPVATALAGQTLSIPIGGTLGKPRIDAAGLGRSGINLLDALLGGLTKGEKVDLDAVLKTIAERRRQRKEDADSDQQDPPAPVLDLLRDALGTETPLLDRLRRRRKQQEEK